MTIFSLPKLAALLFVSFTFAGHGNKITAVDLSGNWQLNESKSDFGEFGSRFAAKSIKIDQDASSVTIAKNITTFNGENTTRTEKLGFDGSATETALGIGNSKRKATAKWSEDGNVLIVTYTVFFDFNGQSGEMPGTETYTLSEDGKSLTVNNEASGPQGEIKTRAAYDKQ